MKKFLLLILSFFPLLLLGQNDIQLTQQFLSRANYNPAATGASNYFNAYLLGRQQFVGFKGAPSTQVLNAHNYFDQVNSGMGLSVIHDKIGETNSFNAKILYAYHVHFENNSYLSFGLGAGLLHKKLNINDLVSETGLASTDPTLATYIDRYSKFNPDFDFGIEYNMEIFQVGASITHLNLPSVDINNLQSGRHYYFYTKFNIDLDFRKDWRLVPHAVVHMSSWPIMQLEFNTIAYYKSRFWFGPIFRFSDEFKFESIAGVAGLFITDFLRLGYSYDFNLSSIRRYTGGTHEIMLSLRLGQGDSGYGRKTPRFFE